MTTAVTRERPKVICSGDNPYADSWRVNKPMMPQQIPAATTQRGAIRSIFICTTF